MILFCMVAGYWIIIVVRRTKITFDSSYFHGTKASVNVISEF